MAFRRINLFLSFIGVLSVASGLGLTKDSLQMPRHLEKALTSGNNAMKTQDTTTWVITSLYYSTTCSTTGAAPFVDGAEANACLVSADEPGQSYIYTCNSDSTYTVTTYSGSDCNSQPLSTHTQSFACEPYVANNTLIASYQVQCASGDPYVLPSDYIVTSSSWSPTCDGDYDFSGILNRACASYINATTDAVYSLYYDYPYSYYFPTMSCAGNYTYATSLSGEEECKVTGSAGFNTLYGSRNLTDSITAAGVRPSAAPTVTPTVVPTLLPTVVPTVYPTVMPTQNPSFRPTAVPTVAIVPTRLPTIKPTPFPTAVVTIEPTGGQYVITISFTCIQIVIDLDISGYDVEIDINIYIWRITIASVTGCDPDDVTVNSMSSSGDKLASAQGVVDYTIKMNVDGSSSPQDTYNSFTSKLNAALADGSFTQTLQATATQYGATDMLYASSNSVTYSEPVVETTEVTSSSSSSPFTTGVIAAMIIGAVVLIAAIAGGVYWKYYRKASVLRNDVDLVKASTITATASEAGPATLNPMTA